MAMRDRSWGEHIMSSDAVARRSNALSMFASNAEIDLGGVRVVLGNTLTCTDKHEPDGLLLRRCRCWRLLPSQTCGCEVYTGYLTRRRALPLKGPSPIVLCLSWYESAFTAFAVILTGPKKNEAFRNCPSPLPQGLRSACSRCANPYSIT
jgi:hypothetical protein